jgi:hypothetical protein
MTALSDMSRTPAVPNAPPEAIAAVGGPVKLFGSGGR